MSVRSKQSSPPFMIAEVKVIRFLLSNKKVKEGKVLASLTPSYGDFERKVVLAVAGEIRFVSSA